MENGLESQSTMGNRGVEKWILSKAIVLGSWVSLQQSLQGH